MSKDKPAKGSDKAANMWLDWKNSMRKVGDSLRLSKHGKVRIRRKKKKK